MKRLALITAALFALAAQALGATVGTTTVGGSIDYTSSQYVAAQETATSSGPLLSISLYTTQAGETFNLALYDNTGASGKPGNLLTATGTGASVAGGWVTLSTTSGATVSAGQTVYLAIGGNVHYAYAAGTGMYYTSSTTFPGFTTPYPASAAYSEIPSIYGTLGNTFGYTTLTSTANTIGLSTNRNVETTGSCCHVAVTGETVTALGFYGYKTSGTPNVYMSLYAIVSKSATTCIGSTATFALSDSSTGWHNVTGLSWPLTASTTYGIAIAGSGSSIGIVYCGDAGSSHQTASGATMPTNFAATSSSGSNLALAATFTVTAPSSGNPQAAPAFRPSPNIGPDNVIGPFGAADPLFYERWAATLRSKK